ncbi:hypothetical protein [Beijerinckia indica]|uniref:Uncharacterized protein n=1 Tax=Beijerinckia indica subsp. indica (strain ATCC 9039 / DSM 1715 / NCIMB 8712) TaxID=395963 RepID=B2IEZ5_BEII9|nr:hypothetical protein [Beijerinckia indica]ACB94186.1 conserved hypothetical protein [Beijerinckia indica subsp. indica ATCC 9039]
MKIMLACLAAGSTLLAINSATYAEHAKTNNAELIQRLNTGAPPAVVKNATILDGDMKPVREGTNGWTCLEVMKAPTCADEAGMEWLKALMAKGPAPQKIGFIYMLHGDEGASNTDPFATGKTADNYWITTGPHVMIVGAAAKDMMQAYPRDPKADPNKPYVMWPGTPYEHLMLPVK